MRDGGVGDPRRTEGGGGGVEEETCGRGDGGDPTGARDPRRTEGAEGEPSGDRARADEWERTMEELDESDIRACVGFLPLSRTGLASGTLGQTENGTGLGTGTLEETENGTGLGTGTVIEEAQTMRHSTSWSRPCTLGSVASFPRRERW